MRTYSTTLPPPGPIAPPSLARSAPPCTRYTRSAACACFPSPSLSSLRFAHAHLTRFAHAHVHLTRFAHIHAHLTRFAHAHAHLTRFAHIHARLARFAHTADYKFATALLALAVVVNWMDTMRFVYILVADQTHTHNIQGLNTYEAAHKSGAGGTGAFTWWHLTPFTWDWHETAAEAAAAVVAAAAAAGAEAAEGRGTNGGNRFVNVRLLRKEFSNYVLNGRDRNEMASGNVLSEAMEMLLLATLLCGMGAPLLLGYKHTQWHILGRRVLVHILLPLQWVLLAVCAAWFWQ